VTRRIGQFFSRRCWVCGADR
jgi:hypothetical protein